MPSIISAGTTVGTALSLTSDTSGELQIQTNNGATTAMTLTTGGNVGIGTTTPASLLAVNGVGTFGSLASKIRIGLNGDSISSDGDLYIQTSTANFISLRTNFAERMRIASGGNVLVGSTVDNGYKFKVVGGNANGFLLDNDGSQFTQLLLQRNSTTNTGGDILIDGTNSQFQIRGLLAGPMIFQTSSTVGSPVERMRIDSAGNVGIGTNSPGQVLEVSKSQDTETQVRVVNANTGSSARSGFVLGNNSNAGAASLLLNSSNNTGLGGANSLNVYMGLSAPIAFFTNAAERMRILDTGEVCIGRTNALGSGTLLSITSASGNASINCGDAADGTAYGIVQICRAGDQPDNKFHLSFIRTGQKIAGMGFLDNSNTFAIQNSSNNTGAGVGLTDGATSWSTVSDERKKNIVGNVEDALAKLADWRTVYFKYKTDEEDTPQRVGLIAQDVLATLPEVVSAEEDELKTLQVRYTETVPLLVKAIQELKAELDSVKAELQTLKGA
jgi:hypothetical protein